MQNTIPLRKDVPAKDKWDLTTIFNSVEDWEKALSQVPILSASFCAYKGRLAESKETLCKGRLQL